MPTLKEVLAKDPHGVPHPDGHNLELDQLYEREIKHNRVNVVQHYIIKQLLKQTRKEKEKAAKLEQELRQLRGKWKWDNHKRQEEQKQELESVHKAHVFRLKKDLYEQLTEKDQVIEALEAQLRMNKKRDEEN